MTNKNWYKKHLAQIEQKAGVRYTPELNVDLPISEIFDGISKTECFYTTIRKNYGELFREFRYVTSKYEKDKLQKKYDLIKKEIEELFKIVEGIKDYDTNKIPWDNIRKQTKKLHENLWEFTDKLRKERDQVIDIKNPPRKDGSYQQSRSEKFNSDIHHIYKTQESIRYFEELSSSTKAQLSNHPFLLLTGSAGTGKTHLLCDVVEQRIKNETDTLPAFLVFGEFFSDDADFWSQVLKQLEIENTIKTKEDFLKKIDKLGKDAKCRSLFIIDALNENITHAPNFWKNNLNKVIQEVNKYPNIALIMSVRSGFENEVLTEKQNTLFIHEEHHGFRFREWDAVNKFFKAFSLTLPEIPLLMPEFQNPLFLLLFCKAFEHRVKENRTNEEKGKRERQMFRGHEGAT
ncbi:MAG: ATP-binding protein, partial [Thermoplasmatales archaeon]|nr:ATP-binding protein [Thermoplasmatales archaeon]